MSRHESPPPVPNTIHATALERRGSAVLLLGASGAGKSDLALRLMDSGFRLIADDRVIVEPRQDRLWAQAPDILSGLLEVRGVGIVPVPVQKGAVPVVLAVDLVSPEQVDRLPDPGHLKIVDVAVCLFRLYAFEPSAPLKVRLAFDLALQKPPFFRDPVSDARPPS